MFGRIGSMGTGFGRLGAVGVVKSLWQQLQRALFSNSEQGLFAPINDLYTLGRLYQDTAGTVLADAVNDPVARPDDLSGNGNNPLQSTATARPLLKQTAGGRWHLEFDETDDEYTVTLPDITDGTVVLIGTNGIWIDDAFNHTSGTWTLGYNSGSNNYTGGPNGILDTVGGVLGIIVLDRQLTAAERQSVIDYGLSVGSPGYFELGDELVVNGDFSSSAGWTTESGWAISGGVLSASGTITEAYRLDTDVSTGDLLLGKMEVSNYVDGAVQFRSGGSDGAGVAAGNGVFRSIITAGGGGRKISVDGTTSFTGDVDNVSARKLTLVTA